MARLCFLSIIAILFIISLAGIACATPPARPDDVLWSKTFDGNGTNGCLISVGRTPDDGYVFAGVSRPAAAPGAYAGLTDKNGSLLWDNVYLAEGSWFNAVVNAPDGNYLLVGASNYNDGYLLKAGRNGSRLFHKSYRAPDGICELKGAIPEADGSLVVLGITDNRTRVNNLSAGGIFIHVLKTDADGNPLWSMGYGHGNLEPCDIARSPDGGYAIAGFVFTQSGGMHYGYLLRIDGTGDFLWEVCYLQAGDIAFHTLCNAGDDGYLLAGDKETGNCTAIYLSRVALNGTELWNRTLNSSEFPYEVIQASDGGFVLACGAEILKVNEHGEVEWQRNFGEAQGFLNCVAEAADGSYVFGGTTVTGGNRSAWLVGIGDTKSQTAPPEGPGCWPMLILPAVAVSVATIGRRRLR